MLFRNEGPGHFADVTKASGIEVRNQPAALTLITTMTVISIYLSPERRSADPMEKPAQVRT